MNRIKRILKSRLTGNVAIAGIAVGAVIYTIPHSSSGSNPIEEALARVSRDWVTQRRGRSAARLGPGQPEPRPCGLVGHEVLHESEAEVELCGLARS